MTISQDCGLMYISRYYRLRPGHDYPALDTPVMAVLDWARGTSLAFAQAQHLAATLGNAADPLSCTAGFDAWTDANIGAWYQPQAQADASLARRMQAAVDGQPSPPPQPAERLRLAIFNAARTDAPVAVALRRIIHLVSLPENVIGNETVRAQLDALLAAHPELTAQAAGPSREQIAARA